MPGQKNKISENTLPFPHPHFFAFTRPWTILKNYGPHYLLLALTIGGSLVGVVLWGSLVGAMLPILRRFFRLDPATCSAPFVATMVDVTGIVIYFNVAFHLLRGTVL